ncbi:hypothetical protein GIB67_001251 [Kingdonia uniflora]|uniref:Disease resistance protein winged helix domain-containing protein n=1 Tax=Kingdonia uniflora TaxID=39325 RepID=A0A7J7L7V2_9MAGN|nr:hypothetical protein GIB67_001251 [Kingdonia uniflora]
MPRKRNVDDWEDFLASDIWKFPTAGELALSPLLLSYNALPSHLKHCFTYCAVFPKDHIIEKDLLIKMWMAEGCIRSSETRETRELESIGAEFIDELKLSNDTGKMVSLRHHKVEECYSLKCFPRGIGKLRDLQTLTKFVVSEEGADIGELKDLNNLCGSLCRRYISTSNSVPQLKEAFNSSYETLGEVGDKDDHKYQYHASSSKAINLELPIAEVIARPNLIFFTKGNDNRQLSVFGGLLPSPVSGEVGVMERCRFCFDIITHTKWSPHQPQVSRYLVLAASNTSTRLITTQGTPNFISILLPFLIKYPRRIAASYLTSGIGHQ